jgi:hypothetical protein
MEYFKNKTVDDFTALHNGAFPNTSDATKTTFYQALKRIERLYGNKKLPEIQLSFLTKPDEFLNLLEASKYSENTKLTTLTSILKLCKIIDLPLIQYNNWLTILKDKTEARSKNESEALKNKLKVISDFKDIKMIVYDKANHYINNDVSLNDFKDFLILALFTIQIPVRVSNYVNMKVVDNDVYTNEKDNFLVVNDEGYKFIFNRYRTSHVLGKKVLLVKEKTLQYLIDKWLAVYNKDSQNFLIISQNNRRPMNGKQIENSITKITQAIFDSPLTIDNIRASYMKKIADLDPDFQDKLDIANILGYINPAVIDKHNSKET